MSESLEMTCKRNPKWAAGEIDRLTARNDFLDGTLADTRLEITGLRVGMEKAATTFMELEHVLRMFDRPVLADTCKVAKDGTVAILVDSMPEPHRSILLGRFQ